MLGFLFVCMKQVGEWSTVAGLNITDHAAFQDFGTTNITLRVTTIESTPYVFYKKNLNNQIATNNSNDHFEGFCIDLLKAIAEMLNFQYELYLVPDGKYGAENTTTGEWNGLVREIIDKVIEFQWFFQLYNNRSFGLFIFDLLEC